MSERMDDNYISLEEAAEYLNIKPVTLRKWIKQKTDLPAHQLALMEVQTLRTGRMGKKWEERHEVKFCKGKAVNMAEITLYNQDCIAAMKQLMRNLSI